jgi:hypothetical protein
LHKFFLSFESGVDEFEGLVGGDWGIRSRIERMDLSKRMMPKMAILFNMAA